MPLTRKKKEEVVGALAEVAKSASAIVFADFFGLKTKDMNELRKTVKSLGGTVKIVKKTLAQRGLKDTVPQEVLDRPGGIAAIWFKVDDVPFAFKSVWQFSRINQALNIVGGYSPAFGGIMNAESVITLAKLPSREALYGQLVRLLASPLTGLVKTLNGNLQKLAFVLNALQRSK